MIIRIMNSHIAGQPSLSKWIDLEPEMKGRNEKAVSLQISWKDIAGAMDGSIIIKGANDQSSAGYSRIYKVDTADNYDDAEMIILRRTFKYLQVRYIPAGTISGTINANIYFK